MTHLLRLSLGGFEKSRLVACLRESPSTRVWGLRALRVHTISPWAAVDFQPLLGERAGEGPRGPWGSPPGAVAGFRERGMCLRDSRVMAS